MSDTITTDSSWSPTFQLVWNDLKNKVAKKDIVFDHQEKFAKNLNKEEFTENMISDSYYYKAYGLKTLELKSKIEKGIKEKFNKKSDILDKLDWSEESLNQEDSNVETYLLYSMLYRKFKYLYKFDKLNNGKFGKYENIKYFGIDNDTNNEVRHQMEVLYYNSKNDFAIIINTKSEDEVIFVKNPKGDNFKQIYDNMTKKAKAFKGNKIFESKDLFKAPYIKINMEKEYKELENKKFETKDGLGKIIKAIQTIEFELNEKGCEVTSEGTIIAENFTSSANQEEPRYFYLDDTFCLFLREKNKSLPYFASRIENIEKFQ